MYPWFCKNNYAMARNYQNPWYFPSIKHNASLGTRATRATRGSWVGTQQGSRMAFDQKRSVARASWSKGEPTRIISQVTHYLFPFHFFFKPNEVVPTFSSMHRSTMRCDQHIKGYSPPCTIFLFLFGLYEARVRN